MFVQILFSCSLVSTLITRISPFLMETLNVFLQIIIPNTFVITFIILKAVVLLLFLMSNKHDYHLCLFPWFHKSLDILLWRPMSNVSPLFLSPSITSFLPPNFCISSVALSSNWRMQDEDKISGVQTHKWIEYSSHPGAATLIESQFFNGNFYF